MYKHLLNQQFQIDFNCTAKELEQHYFTTSNSTLNARYWARNKADIVCYDNKLFVRTDNHHLTKELSNAFSNIDGEWLLEKPFFNQLVEILTSYDLVVDRVCPFFIPQHHIDLNLVADGLTLIPQKEIIAFKKDQRIEHAFGYFKQDPDMFGIAYYEQDDLIGIAGANKNGRFTWEIGVEILNSKYSKKGLATKLVQASIATIQRKHQAILPVYGTAFSHVNSINLAIRAGCQLGWTEIIITDK